MSSRLHDAEHLVRLGGLFTAGVLLFLLVRGLLIPDGFGAIGHYRVGAIDDNRDQPPVYAGREACTDCHSEVVEAKTGGAHAAIGCEACHGPLAGHAGDPAGAMPELPDPQRLCLGCHRSSVTKPEWFPQVAADEHAAGEPCGSCHLPHVPL
ncbi:MAG TPA: multiheme c-type cytochrome [Candidatus Polarisedimenticolaceae bacterium]|nr:multiheme c-type cytochrome [Candidatus Polarisedimenticolaceae bacterium]